MQSPSTAHVTLHALSDPHAYSPQGVFEIAPLQLRLLPSQACAVSVLAEVPSLQLLLHTVPEDAGTHAPAWHPAAQGCAHAPCGSLPSATGAQEPIEPGRLHARHPPHAEAQQTPSAQKPLAHSAAELQLAPNGSGGGESSPGATMSTIGAPRSFTVGGGLARSGGAVVVSGFEPPPQADTVARNIANAMRIQPDFPEDGAPVYEVDHRPNLLELDSGSSPE